jgi:general secretion pathway protein M
MKNLVLNLAALRSLSFKSLQLPFSLQTRERRIVAIAAGILAVLIVLQVIIFPVMDKRTVLRRQIDSKILGLHDIYKLKSEYETLTLNVRDTASDLARRPKGFTLFSFLDGLAGRSGIKQNIAYMKPSTAQLKNSPYALSIVEVKVQSLTMAQLIDFLHGIENGRERVWIKRMSIAKDDNNTGLITSVLLVETHQL